jgi:hypothetical protein
MASTTEPKKQRPSIRALGADISNDADRPRPAATKVGDFPPLPGPRLQPFPLVCTEGLLMILTEDNVAVTSRRSLRRSQVRWTSNPLMCTSKRTWRAWFRAASPQTFNLLQAQIQRVWSLDTGYVTPCKAAVLPPQNFVLF